MLKNNYYILCPPGYFGTYIHWIINKSNKTTADATVDNPINSSANSKYGGAGTAHGHVKVPTHITWNKVLAWKVLNPNLGNRVFAVNAGETIEDQKTNFKHERSIQMDCASISLTGLHSADRTPVFINMYAKDTVNYRFGVINQILKWPTFFVAGLDLLRHMKAVHPTFDPFDCNSMADRNFFLEQTDWVFRTNTELSDALLLNTKQKIEHWVKLRHSLHPHELPLDQYVSEYTAKVSNVNVGDVILPNFVDILESKLAQSGVDMEDFDFNYCKSFHHTFVEAQPSAKWFDEIAKFDETKVCTEFFKSHAIYAAMLLATVGGPESLPSGWQKMETEDIIERMKK